MQAPYAASWLLHSVANATIQPDPCIGKRILALPIQSDQICPCKIKLTTSFVQSFLLLLLQSALLKFLHINLHFLVTNWS